MFITDSNFNRIHKSVTVGKNVTIGNFCLIEKDVVLGDNVNIGDYVKIKANTVVADDVVLGSYVRTGGKQIIGKGTIIKCRATLSAEVDIGQNCFIGPHALLLHANPKGQHLPCLIEEGAYVGSHVTVLPNVKIGKRSIIGTGSVVTKDVGDDVTVMGIPAREK